jgi:hypothetical protein
METSLTNILCDLAGLVAGGGIGLAFGLLQQVARRRNEERERSGEQQSGWSLMPGSGVRVAYLVLTLAAVQVICPLLFREGTQWWVSAGVVFGYGVTLYRELRLRMALQSAK